MKIKLSGTLGDDTTDIADSGDSNALAYIVLGIVAILILPHMNVTKLHVDRKSRKKRSPRQKLTANVNATRHTYTLPQKSDGSYG